MADSSFNGFQSETFARVAESPGPISLWLVDDNRRLRSTLSEIFDNCSGIRCTGTFHSPNAVLSALASKVGPDVILLDMHMGDANGLDAIRPIKSLSRSTQVLMLTTFQDVEAESRALTSGASGFLLKSFPLEKIIHSIRQAWSNPAPHLKRSSCQPAVAGPVPEPVAQPATGESKTVRRFAAEQSRKPLLWVKHCLSFVRSSRN